MKKSPFGFGDKEWPSASTIFKVAVPSLLKLMMFSLFVVVYSQVGILEDLYLEDIPVVSELSAFMGEEATAGNLIAVILSLFSVLIPLTIFMQAFEHRVFDDPQAFFSERKHQVILALACFLMALIVCMETVSLHTTIIKHTLGSIILVPKGPDHSLMGLLAANKSYAIFISLFIAVINLSLSFYTAFIYHSLKQSER